jgi:hypothetical protein
MIQQQAANDNDPVAWWEQAVPILLGIIILIITVRTALRAFF